MPEPVEPVTLVCGFGRCGSSLVMQMLEAGGVPVTGSWPTFECDAATLTTWDGQWIARQHGAAVKMLAAHLPECRLPDGDFRSIWIDRDPRQQTRSHAKFLRTMSGVEMGRRNRQAWMRSLQTDRKHAIQRLESLGPLMQIRFEQIIQNRTGAAEALGLFCDISDQRRLNQMAAAVRVRDTAVRPDMSLELELIRQRTA